MILGFSSSSHSDDKESKKGGAEKIMGGGSNLETRSLLDELKSFDTCGLFDLGHPLLNRVVENFVKAAGVDTATAIGAVQAVSREAYFAAIESAGVDTGVVPDITGGQKHRPPEFKGENYRKSLEALVTNTGKESFQWGMAAGMYSGLTYGLKEARGSHDWKSSAVAGAITGAALSLTSDGNTHERVVQFAVTGAALSTAASLLTGIF